LSGVLSITSDPTILSLEFYGNAPEEFFNNMNHSLSIEIDGYPNEYYSYIIEKNPTKNHAFFIKFTF